MLITDRELRTLINEALLHGRASRAPKLEDTRMYIIEKKGVRSVSFGVIAERRRRGVLSEQAAMRLWERSVRYELDQLLMTEGMMDNLKDAYESLKGGAIKIKDQISDAAAAAWEKANDFILKTSLQAMNLAERSVEGIVKAAQMLSGAVERFRDNHPILYKIVKILVIMLIIWGIMSLFSGEAQAAVKMKSGKSMTEEQYNTLRGALGQYGGGDVEKVMNAGEAIKVLDKAYQAKEAIPVSKLGSMNQAGLKMINGLVDEARGGDESAFKLLMKWQKFGQKLVVN